MTALDPILPVLCRSLRICFRDLMRNVFVSRILTVLTTSWIRNSQHHRRRFCRGDAMNTSSPIRVEVKHRHYWCFFAKSVRGHQNCYRPAYEFFQTLSNIRFRAFNADQIEQYIKQLSCSAQRDRFVGSSDTGYLIAFSQHSAST